MDMKLLTQVLRVEGVVWGLMGGQEGGPCQWTRKMENVDQLVLIELQLLKAGAKA